MPGEAGSGFVDTNVLVYAFERSDSAHLGESRPVGAQGEFETFVQIPRLVAVSLKSCEIRQRVLDQRAITAYVV